MTPVVLPSAPVSFPDSAASFMLDGPAGKLETISDVAMPAGAPFRIMVKAARSPGLKLALEAVEATLRGEAVKKLPAGLTLYGQALYGQG